MKPFTPEHNLRNPRQLFPDFNDPQLSTARRRRAYVLRRLDEMAEAGELYLTECLALGDPIRDLVAQACLGHDFDAKGTFRAGQRIPNALNRWEVQLSSLEVEVEVGVHEVHGRMVPKYMPVRHPIAIKLPAVEDDTLSKEEAYEAGLDSATDAPNMIPQIVEYDNQLEVKVPLFEAVYALRAQGAFVRRARGARLQHFLWRVIEVPPLAWLERYGTKKRKSSASK